MEILSWVLFGFVVGLVARALLPGRDTMGLVATTVLGIIGALFGGWLGRALGFYGAGQNIGFLGATLGAVLVLFVYNRTMQSRARRSGLHPIGHPGEKSERSDRRDRAA